MGTDTTTRTPALAERFDPDGLVAGTREVYWWAAFDRGHVYDEEDDVRARGAEPSTFRAALLSAWYIGSDHDHARLRIVYPEYAGAMLMFKMRGLAGVREFLDALLLDVADITSARRRQTWEPRP